MLNNIHVQIRSQKNVVYEGYAPRIGQKRQNASSSTEWGCGEANDLTSLRKEKEKLTALMGAHSEGLVWQPLPGKV